MSSPSHEPPIPVEPERVARRPVTRVGVAGVVITLVAIAVSGWIERASRHALGRPDGAPATRTAPREIGLVDQTQIEFEDYGRTVRSAQQHQLAHYGWVDRGAGIARIPIERAMDIVAASAPAAAASTTATATATATAGTTTTATASPSPSPSPSPPPTTAAPPPAAPPPTAPAAGGAP